MEVSEKALSEIGGWAAMKSARQLVDMGSVEEASREGDTFIGYVKAGGKRLRSQLIVKSASDAECRCGCPEAGRGLVCPHSIAVALSFLRGKPTLAARPHSMVATAAKEVKPAPALPIAKGVFSVTLDLERLLSAPQRPQTLMLQFQPGEDSANPRIIRWLQKNSLPMKSQPLALNGQDLSEFLSVLGGYSQVLNRHVKNGKITTDHLTINDSLHLTLNLKLNAAQSVDFEVVEVDLRVISIGRDHWIFTGNQQLSLLNQLEGELAPFWNSLREKGRVEKTLRWYAGNQVSLSESFEVRLASDELNQLRIEPAKPAFLVEIDGSLKQIEAFVTAKIEDTTIPLGGANSLKTSNLYPVVNKLDKLHFYTENKPAEAVFLRRLLALGFTQTPDGKLRLQGEDEVLRFYASNLPKLSQFATVTLSERWKAATRGLLRIQPKAILSGREEKAGGAAAGSGADWLTLEVAYESAGGHRVPRNEVLRLIRSGKSSLRGQDGRTYILDAEMCEDFEEALEDSHSRFGPGQQLKVPLEAGEILAAFSDPKAMSSALGEPMTDAELRAILGEAFLKMLRPYQLEGVRWLERLDRSRRGGLLADDMGLGKTLQSLSLLRLVLSKAEAQAANQPALVVCPTSLLSNWAAEAERFAPELPCVILHGNDRKTQYKALTSNGIVLTTYGLISRDLEIHRAQTYRALIMDEASYLRNPDTEAAKALRQIKAVSRFALTGTPVENSVQDLWSIYQILLPGYLGGRDDFRDRFHKPLSSATDRKDRSRIMERLRRRVNPYLLRRTKGEVAKDLPAKIEKVIWCPLTSMQQEYYQKLLAEGREEIKLARKRSGQAGSRATMFTVLLRLRQVCNDLRLLGIPEPKGLENWTSGEEAQCSGKWSALREFFTEIREIGGKTLIFSQFVSMLKLIKPLLDEQELPYCYLDGSSSDRGEQVSAFQKDESKKAFLISLKAGGYGLNLTAAENVVLVDPWWNPAVETQAIDRAHRIGQTNPVTAYRFVSKGTIEEKILLLQSKKRETAELAIDDEPMIMNGLNENDLDELLA